MHGWQMCGLSAVVLALRPRFPDTSGAAVISAPTDVLNQRLARFLFSTLLTVHDQYLIDVDGIEYVARVSEVFPIIDEENEDGGGVAGEEDDFIIPDYYRGTAVVLQRVPFPMVLLLENVIDFVRSFFRLLFYTLSYVRQASSVMRRRFVKENPIP
jgi:hypothetical protein